MLHFWKIFYIPLFIIISQGDLCILFKTILPFIWPDLLRNGFKTTKKSIRLDNIIMVDGMDRVMPITSIRLLQIEAALIDRKLQALVQWEF